MRTIFIAATIIIGLAILACSVNALKSSMTNRTAQAASIISEIK